MQKVQLNSRLISSVAYNTESQTLHVWLNDRRHVVHHNISEAIYANLVGADSAGFYYTCYIARNEPPARSATLRIVGKLAFACMLSMLLIGVSATSIATLN